jgi:hypothetical protein
VDNNTVHRIEYFANVSVARACGFAGLAISTLSVGLLGDPALALQAAGYLFLLTCAVLLLKAYMAATRSYKKTEVWIMLPPQERPSAVFAQIVIGRALRQTFLHYAKLSAASAIILLGLSTVLRLLQ